MEQKAISSDLIRGHIDTIILHSLTSGDKYAQQISDFVEQKSENEYKLNQATLYSSLKRLESLKQVSSYWYDTAEGSGRRKYFKLTDIGKQTVDDNLSSWSYSRAIIDKLIDCSPQPIIETKIIEKIVEVPVEKTVYVPVQTANSDQTTKEKTTITAQNIEQSTKPLESASTQDKISEIKVEEKLESNTELNFRNILSGLIKSTVIQKQSTQELQPLNKQNLELKPNEKMNFNETIASSEYNNHKVGNTGKIDFGDLMLKAAKEGYKLRVSSKDSGVAPGKILINKLNLFASLAIYLIALIELLYFTTSFGSILNSSSGIIIGSILVLTLFPAIRLIIYLKNPTKKSSKDVTANKILTAAIVVFNLLIITLAANLLSNVSFSNLNVVLLSFIIPCVLYADVLAYFILKYLIAKFSAFNLKSKKTAV